VEPLVLIAIFGAMVGCFASGAGRKGTLPSETTPMPYFNASKVDRTSPAAMKFAKPHPAATVYTLRDMAQ
jgi:hypothetical protein